MSIEQNKKLSKIQKLKDVTRTVLKSIASGQTFVEEEEWDKRLSICVDCPQSEPIVVAGLKCRLCGCFLNAKTRFSGASCPLNKW